MTEVVATALLPPASLAVLVLVLLLARRRRAALVALLALLLLAMEAAPHVLIAPLLTPDGEPPTDAPGAIVVFDGGLTGMLNPSDLTPGLETLPRLRTAASLHRRTALPILVTGGRTSRSGAPVGTAMAGSLADDFGVPTAWVETRSANLWQSADVVAALLRARSIGTIYLVAEPWEMRLGAAVFRAAGLAVVPAPVPHASLRPLAIDAFVPLSPVWLDSATALRQWAGLACQAMPPCVAAMRAAPGG